MKKIAVAVCCMMVAVPRLMQGNVLAANADVIVALMAAKHLETVAAEKKAQGKELTFLEKHPYIGGVVYGAAANQTSHEIGRK